MLIGKIKLIQAEVMLKLITKIRAAYTGFCFWIARFILFWIARFILLTLFCINSIIPDFRRFALNVVLWSYIGRV